MDPNWIAVILTGLGLIGGGFRWWWLRIDVERRRIYEKAARRTSDTIEPANSPLRLTRRPRLRRYLQVHRYVFRKNRGLWFLLVSILDDRSDGQDKAYWDYVTDENRDFREEKKKFCDTVNRLVKELSILPAETIACLFYREVKNGLARAHNERLRQLAEHPSLNEITASLTEASADSAAQSTPAPPLPGRAALPLTNLPPPPDIFIGRADLLAELRERIQAGGVTILKGEGGIGKTALALKAAHDALKDGELSGGVAWLDCERLSNHEVCLREAAYVFFGDRMEKEHFERCGACVLEHLNRCDALIIFDNFESVADDDVLLSWLARVREPARVLVTTREDLRARVGWVLNIPELPRNEAVALFSKRAEAVGWDGHRQDLVDSLCALVGDLPLAIELLAAQAGALPLPTLTQMVSDSLATLEARQDPTRPERHKEITVCFGISFDRLSAEARDLLTRFSILPDGLAEERIAAFTEVEAWQKPAAECVRCSLLRLEDGRYRFNSLVRRFAFEQLGNDARRTWQCHFIAYFRQLAVDNHDINDLAKLAVLDAEWHNAVAAAETAEELKDWCAVSTISEYLGDFLHLRGLWLEHERLSRRAIAAARAAGDREAEERALNNLGNVYEAQRRWAEAEACYQQSLAIQKEFGDSAGEGYTLNNLGIIHQRQGRWVEAEMCYQQSLAILREFGNREGEGTTLMNLGNVYQLQGQWAEAEAAYQHSLAILREFGNRMGEGHTLINLGVVYEKQGRWAEAEACYQQSLAIKREFRDRIGEGQTLGNLGNVYQLQGRWTEAEESYQQSLAIYREFGDRVGEGETLGNLGNVYEAQGRWEEAEACYQQDLAVCREFGNREGEGRTLMNLGNIYEAQGQWTEAEKSYQQRLAICREFGNCEGEGGTLMNLGNVYGAQGRWVEAEESYQQSLAIVSGVRRPSPRGMGTGEPRAAARGAGRLRGGVGVCASGGGGVGDDGGHADAGRGAGVGGEVGRTGRQ